MWRLSMDLLRFFRRHNRILRPVEQQVLAAVGKKLNAAARERFEKQVGLVNKVQRFTAGREVNLYCMRGGKVWFDDTLRFPLCRPEVRLATVSVRVPGRVPAIRSDVWLANGRVFSMVFASDLPEDIMNSAEVLDTRIWVDPMQADSDADHGVDVGAVERWFGTFSGKWHVRAPKPALRPESYEEQLEDILPQLPGDLLDLFRISGGFEIGNWTVHGPDSLRTIVLQEGELVVLGENTDGAVLGVRRDDPERMIYFSSPGQDSVALRSSMRDSLREMLTVGNEQD